MNTKKSVDALTDANKVDREITLSTGVVLRGKLAPPLILMSMMAKHPRPKPPVYRNEQIGRMIENPDDPDYLQQIAAWNVEKNDAVLNALILLGTEVVSVPKGMSGHKSNEWLDEYKILDPDIFPDSMPWRYLNWVKFKAATETSDLTLIQEVVGRLSGVPEKDVQTAEDFPGRDSP